MVEEMEELFLKPKARAHFIPLSRSASCYSRVEEAHTCEAADLAAATW